MTQEKVENMNGPLSQKKLGRQFIIEDIFYQKKTKTNINIFREIKEICGIRGEQYDKGLIKNKDYKELLEIQNMAILLKNLIKHLGE